MKSLSKKQKKDIIKHLIDDGGIDWITSDKEFFTWICSNFNLFEDFIRQYKDVLNWDEMCKNKIVNDSDMLREFRDKINFELYLDDREVTDEKIRREFRDVPPHQNILTIFVD